jgi:hypothetical protein
MKRRMTVTLEMPEAMMVMEQHIATMEGPTGELAWDLWTEIDQYVQNLEDDLDQAEADKELNEPLQLALEPTKMPTEPKLLVKLPKAKVSAQVTEIPEPVK